MQPSQKVAMRMNRLVSEFTSAERTATRQAAMVAKEIQNAAIRSAVGADMRLSGVGPRGARVGTRFNFIGNGDALVKATGPLHLVENPSKPHAIPGARRRRGPRRPLATPYGPRWSVNHPGVRDPKQPWKKGSRAARLAVRKTMDRRYGSAFVRAMRG